MINNRIYSVLFKLALVVTSFIALYDTCYSADSDTFAYFTTLSNVLVFVVFLIVLVKNIIDIKNNNLKGYNTHLLKFKNTATLAITVTFLVYAFLLANYDSKSNYSFRNLGVHYVIPIMVIIDFFLFDKHGTLKWYHPLIWIGTVLTYLPFIFIRAAILNTYPNDNMKYPYFFLDVDEIGVPMVIMWIFILLIVFSVIAYLYFLFDVKKKSKEIEREHKCYS